MLYDVHPRVRLEAVIAARYLREVPFIKVVTAALENDLDPFIRNALRQSARSLQILWEMPFRDGDLKLSTDVQSSFLQELLDEGPAVVSVGEELYERPA